MYTVQCITECIQKNQRNFDDFSTHPQIKQNEKKKQFDFQYNKNKFHSDIEHFEVIPTPK